MVAREVSGRDVPQRIEQPMMVEPVYLFEHRDLNLGRSVPRAPAPSDLGPEQANSGLDHGVVVRVAAGVSSR